MIIKELIEILKQYPEDKEVWIDSEDNPSPIRMINPLVTLGDHQNNDGYHILISNHRDSE